MALIGTAPLDPCEQNKRYDFGGRHEDANLCRHCDAGLCLPHLRETAATQQAGGMNLNCIHDTWLGTSARGPR